MELNDSGFFVIIIKIFESFFQKIESLIKGKKKKKYENYFNSFKNSNKKDKYHEKIQT